MDEGIDIDIYEVNTIHDVGVVHMMINTVNIGKDAKMV
jgi:hypothetical protein